MKKLISIMAFFGVCVAHSIAAPYIEEWSAGTATWQIDDSGRTVDPAHGTLSQNPAWQSTIGGSGSGALQISAPNPGGIKEDIIFANSGSSGGNIAGNKNYAPGFYVQFDFYAQSVTPTKLDVYFLSGSGVAWFYNVTPNVAVGWTHHNVYMERSWGVGWYNMDGAPDSQFVSDVGDVDEIGIKIWYRDGVAQNYGLDNFSVTPEPGTWSIFGSVALGLAYSFRDRFRRRKTKVKAA